MTLETVTSIKSVLTIKWNKGRTTKLIKFYWFFFIWINWSWCYNKNFRTKILEQKLKNDIFKTYRIYIKPAKIA